MTIATILRKETKVIVLYRWVGDPAIFETIEQAQEFCDANGFAVVIRAG